jgi:hypothetical protein
MKAYRDAVRGLLNGKYAALKAYAPAHLRDPMNIWIFCCKDGVLVRFDPCNEEKPTVYAAAIGETLEKLGPQLTDNVVRFPNDPVSFVPDKMGPSIQLEAVEPATGTRRTLLEVHPTIRASPTLAARGSLPPPPHKPPCLISLSNELTLALECEFAPEGEPRAVTKRPQQFLVRAPVVLPTGWRAIEVYPTFDQDYWKPENAPLWAETDLLAAVARKQLENAKFAEIDPNVAARRAFRELLGEFTSLLEGPEEPAHQFLKAHAHLLSPTCITHWSKLPFGKHISDFVLREPDGDYCLVEIESPLRGLFRRDGQQRQELTHAHNQIVDWRIHLANNLESMRNEMGLRGITANPRSMIVIGRSSDLSLENREKMHAIQEQVPRLQILTYDDVIARAKSVAENLFGSLDLVGDSAEIYYR